MPEISPILAVVLILLWPVGVYMSASRFIRALKSGKRLEQLIWFIMCAVLMTFIEWWVWFLMLLFG